jgi:uncharacterized surface protein with fasciclin (FAS1) repeats
MKTIVTLITAALLLTAATGARPAVRQEPGTSTIADILSASGGEVDSDGGDFDLLLQLAKLADLLPKLADPAANFTVFAPTDDAFIQSAKDLGLPNVRDEKSAFDALSSALSTVGGGDPKRIIALILSYHISPSKLSKKDLLAMKTIPTVLEGSDITRGEAGANPKELVDLAPDVTNPKLVKTDIKASNGVIHTIDRLLLGVPVNPALVASAAGGTPPDELDDMDASPEATADSAAGSTPDAGAKTAPGKKGDGGKACFPSSAVVHLADGSELPMAQLLAGHEVKTAADEHSPVFLFTHRQLDGLHEFVRIESESGHALSLSANHYVYANGKLAAADAVRVGDVLSTLDGASRVRRVGTVMERGLVAPHTLHGDIVVNGVRASSYTRSVHPRVAHVLLAPVRAVVRAGLATEPLGGLFYDGADRLAALMPKGI